MKRLGLALLLIACGDDGNSDEATSVGTSTSTSDMTTGEMSSTSSSSESSSSSSSGSAETVAPTTGNTVDVVNCMSLPNELVIMDGCDVRLCVGAGVCEFTNACDCAGGDAQLELRSDPIEVRSVGAYTIADCGANEPIDGMGTGCTNLPAETDLSFTVDDGVGNQVVLEVRKNPESWRILGFTAQ